MKKIFITLAFACTLPSLAMSQNLVKTVISKHGIRKLNFPKAGTAQSAKGFSVNHMMHNQVKMRFKSNLHPLKRTATFLSVWKST